jgi:hypothetical protein
LRLSLTIEVSRTDWAKAWLISPHRDLAGLRWGFLLGLPAQHDSIIFSQVGFVNLIINNFFKESKMAKAQHGGKRPGAGRKVANPDEGRTVTMAVSVPETLLANLDALATERAWNRSEAVTEAIRRLVKAKRKA